MNALLKAPVKIKSYLSTKELRLKLIELKINRFEPKVRFKLKQGKYTIKTAETPQELRKVLELRHSVFIEEWLGEARLGGVDFDRYDLLGDHILLIENTTNKIIGTYRLVCSRFTDKFYSENEFHLAYFLESPGVKLELGRACIHKDYRTGATIHLVWKGLGHYAKMVDADFMFGCTSIHSTSFSEVKCLMDSMKPLNYSDEYYIRPKFNYRFSMFKKKDHLVDTEKVKELIPSLLQSYCKAGAKIHGAPALDRDFQVSDLLTVLNLNTINEKYRKKYL